MANLIERKAQNRGLLLAALAALTLALVIGIRYFMSDDTAAVSERPQDQQQLFKDPAADAPPPGLNPAARSETGSGGGLDMFSKTNAGYYGEEESTGAAAAQTAAAPEGDKPAARKAGAVKAKTKGTVIPRLKSATFGTISPGNAAARGAGQNMPDISNMLKQAGQQAGKTDPSGD
jgi:hypothetical protein